MINHVYGCRSVDAKRVALRSMVWANRLALEQGGLVVKTVKNAVALFVAAALSVERGGAAETTSVSYYPGEHVVYRPSPRARLRGSAPVVVEPGVPIVFGGIYIHGGHGGYRGGHRR